MYAIKIRAVYILTLELSLYIQCLYRPQGLVGQRFNNVVVLGLPGSDMLHLPTGQRVHLHAPSEITPTNPMFFCFLYRLFRFHLFLPKSTQNAMIVR